ncbi:twin-arginine translocase subunit TatC [Halorarum halophilum]|uniref:Sec-independent protein translocase protein TatC n=1 Tax=Halorarum halophilum TaxID=2743090 RepID=A0A7D5GCD3_9EURY|nr:twin-arginine translocase subunit TatC [Halobaculum halophilum]QLG28146.1 twin-arginine translocase subunit TatC [Halobaculum halophilum]
MSSALDEDTQRALAEGQDTARAMLRSAQKDLQKVFIVFLVGFLGTFYSLRLYVWDFLKAVTEARLDSLTAQEVKIIAQTPFDVILLQAKIGLAVGIITAIPVFLYFAREPLRERGLWPQQPVPRWKLVIIGLLAAGLFAGGVAYGYLVFFPFMFAFLANNALSAGIQPNYSIVKWAEFIMLLTFSFGFAAQMPLVVTALSYAEIIPYETFREKWRYAVVLIFVFGAFFSPPDPFTQVMWAVPLLVLYGASLYLAKVVVTAKRGSARVDVPGTARRHWNRLAGVAVLFGGAVGLFFFQNGPTIVNRAIRPYTTARLPYLSDPATIAVAVAVGLVAVILTLAYLVYSELDAAVAVDEPVGEPGSIDLAPLDAAGVRSAPPEAFAGMTEEEALAAAQAAMDDDDPEKAQAILDRFDEAEAADEAGTGAAPESDATPAASGPARDLLASDVGVVGRVRRGTGFVDWRSRIGALWNVLLGIAALVFAAGYVLVERPELADRLLTEYGTSAAALTGALARALPPAVPATGTALLGLFAAAGLLLAALLGGVLALYFAYAAGGDPDAVDIEALSADEVRRAPDAVFAGVSERRANFLASSAAERGDTEKARAVLDRHDDVQRAREAAGRAGGAGAGAAVPGASDDIGDRASRAGGTFLEGLTDGDSDEDDIGGYYDDIAFVANSLRSRLFVLVAVFGVVMVGTFAWLYSGGIGDVRENFVQRLPPEVVGEGAEQFGVIVLHPVEALIFEVKISTLLGIAAVLPFAAYYAWPALRERGFVRGRRQVIFGWVAMLLAGLLGGLVLGYTVIAPTIISWLVGDALRAGIVISYRISDFFWLVIFTTLGIGVLADVPILMVLLNSAGVSYQAMRDRWREVTIAIMLFAALFTPADVITMFLMTVPLMAAYGVGLVVLFVLTLGGRRNLAKPVGTT